MADNMDKEIREASGGDLQDNIEATEGTYQFAPPEPTSGGSTGGGGGGGAESLPGTDSPQAQEARQEFPRASESETIQAAEEAKASFGGTGGMGGGGVESDADPAIATGQKPGMGSGEQSGGGGGEAPSAQDVSDQAEAGDELTTGQKFAGILGSDENMKWESKIAEKLSGGDDSNQ
ncbi:MAG TPA: hypothetical protein VHL54_10195 [Actinomycetota bacterium]|nr:hypothetical protein [Actinomycetota bacterium]